MTELTDAARKGDIDEVRALLKKRSDVNGVDVVGWTALMVAAQKGHTEVVNALLAVNGISINYAEKGGCTALILAADKGHTEVVNALLAVSGININQADNLGNNALLFAAQNGHTKVVAALLDKGADVHCKCKDDSTALHSAAAHHNPEIFQALLDKGAHIEVVSKSGVNCMHQALWHGADSVVVIASAKVVAKQDLRTARALLLKGCPCMGGADLRTPLQWGIYNKHANVVDSIKHAHVVFVCEELKAGVKAGVAGQVEPTMSDAKQINAWLDGFSSEDLKNVQKALMED